MAPIFGTIDMLKPGRSTFGLEAERIHVTIPGSNSEKYKHRLIEGSVYAIIDFVIGLNIMKYRTMSCIHKIIVFKHTRLFEVFHEEFPKCLFEFKTFTDIALMENIGESAMFDEIGTIVSHYRPQQKEINGKNTKLMDLVLEDVDYLSTGKVKSAIISTLTSSSSRTLNDEIKDGDFELKTISEILSEGKEEESVSKTGGEYVEEMDQIIDNLPTEIDELVGVKGFFKIIVLAEKIKEPSTVVKESVARSKGKRKMHENADEVAFICDALETPPTMKSSADTKNPADLIDDDQTNRKLIDEFSSNALKKMQKMNVKK
ncbi:hypothetical protein C2S52_011802 [Perilla frutescens var. hirtella]|nr:hypothetical protein C2S52_011802 [Perilla frutescens var. hirtella]